MTTTSRHRALLAACLAITSIAPAHATVSVETYVVNDTTDTEQRSSVAGATLVASQRKETEVRGTLGEVVATIGADGLARASTEIGLSRVSSAAQWTTFYGHDSLGIGVTGGVWSGAGAQSVWRDEWIIGGGASGDFVSVTIGGTLTGRFGLTDADRALRHPDGKPATVDAFYDAWFGNGGITFTGKEMLDAADASGAFVLPWSVTELVPTGYTLDITSIYAASIASGNLLCRFTAASCSTEASFESFSTAKVTRIELPSGYSLAAGSGQLVARDGYYVYAAVVPEPGTWALVLAGGLAMLAMRRRHHRND